MSMKSNELKVRLDDETNEKLISLVRESKKNKSEVMRDLINKSKVEYISNGKENYQKLCQVHADINAIGHKLNEYITYVEELSQENSKIIQEIKMATENGLAERCFDMVKLNVKKEQLVLESILQKLKMETRDAERMVDEYVDFSCNYES